MKQEFKQGDRVLVRNHDLEEWQEAIFESLAERKEQSHPFIQFCPFIVKLLEGGEFWYKQCRHIDDFRTRDKVQVRSSMNEEWEDAIYGCYVPHDSFEHWVYSEDEDDLTCHKLCRWHPSMPWAEKEPLTLEQRIANLEALQPKNEYRLEVLERKLKER